MRATELLSQLQALIEERGDLEVVRRFDSYCYEDFDGIEFHRANVMHDEDHFVV